MNYPEIGYFNLFFRPKNQQFRKIEFREAHIFLAIISFNMKKLTILNSMLLIPSFRLFLNDLHENRGYNEASIFIQTTRAASSDPL